MSRCPDDSVSQVKPDPNLPPYERIEDPLQFVKELSWKANALHIAVRDLRTRESDFDAAKEAMRSAEEDVQKKQREYLAMSQRLHSAVAYGITL